MRRVEYTVARMLSLGVFAYYIVGFWYATNVFY